MKTKVVLVAGLPGSGKTYYAKARLKHSPGLLIDDIDDLHLLEAAVRQNPVVYITDPHFCIDGVRQKAEQVFSSIGNVEIEWVFFENDPHKCERNIEYRNDGRRVDITLKHLSRLYNPPADALIIWQPKKR